MLLSLILDVYDQWTVVRYLPIYHWYFLIASFGLIRLNVFGICYRHLAILGTRSPRLIEAQRISGHVSWNFLWMLSQIWNRKPNRCAHSTESQKPPSTALDSFNAFHWVQHWMFASSRAHYGQHMGHQIWTKLNWSSSVQLLPKFKSEQPVLTVWYSFPVNSQRMLLDQGSLT